MSAVDLPTLLAANPFPGLRSFEPAEADRFFGRRDQIAALVTRMSQASLVAVSGASGCGKSSLVKAGLLDELARRHREAGETDWRAVVMRPGGHPIAALATALAAAFDGGEPGHDVPVADESADPEALTPHERRIGSLQGQLRQGELALLDVLARARLPAGVRLLVVVDQFEEIFRLKGVSDAEEAAAFVRLLLAAARAVESGICVILTLRSDTLGGCADFPGLAEAVSGGSYLVPRLTRQQRKEAIVGPVALRGHQVSPRLVQRLLSDVSSDFDDLPVMQHALSRTWRRWAADCLGARPIDIEDYEAVGGATSALSRHADEAWEDMDPTRSNDGIVARVFCALTERVAGGVELRRPVVLRELRQICDDGTQACAMRVDAVVDRYRRADTAFLVPAGTTPLGDDTVIDITHEALIRQWDSLRRWVDQEVDSVRIYQRLATTAALHAHGEASLWGQPDLGRAMDWRAQRRPNAAWARRYAGNFEQAMNFLDDSNEDELAIAVAQREKRRGRNALVLMFMAFLLSTVLAWLAADLEARGQRERTSEMTLTSLAFLSHLHDAGHALNQGEDAAEARVQACERARDFLAGIDWRQRQHDEVCDDSVVLVASDTLARLKANKMLAQGQTEDAGKALRNLGGAEAARVLLNLQRVADLDFLGMHRERLMLLEDDKAYRGKTLDEQQEQACIDRVRQRYRHPVHLGTAINICTKEDDLSALQIRLIKTYASRARLNLAGLSESSEEGTSEPFDLDAPNPPTTSPSSMEWIYWQTARNASRPGSPVERLNLVATEMFSEWHIEGAMVLVPIGWFFWRRWQRRRGATFDAAPSPLRRAAAKVVDVLIAVSLLLLGVNAVMLFEGLMARADQALHEDLTFVLLIASSLPAWAYLLLGDAIQVRYRRSVGKIMFDLRPVLRDTAAGGALGVKVCLRRHAALLLVSVLPILVTVAVIYDNMDFNGLRVLQFLIIVGGSLWLLALRRRSLGDRWAGTEVIDSDSTASRARDLPPRYLRPAETAG